MRSNDFEISDECQVALLGCSRMEMKLRSGLAGPAVQPSWASRVGVAFYSVV